MDAYELLVGVGQAWVAAVGTTFPTLSSTPGSSWRDVGETQDGLTVTPDQDVEEITTDQRTGAVLAIRTSESVTLETKLAQHSLENLADVLGVTVMDTPAGTGTIGTREIPLHRGSKVTEFAFLFRGISPYGDFPAQYEVPRGYFGGETALEFVKDNNTPIPVEFHALEDLNAATESERFGRLVAQDAAAL